MAKAVVPARYHARVLDALGHSPSFRHNRRLADYDRRYLVNARLAEAEAAGRIELSMGYPAWNLLYYTVLCTLPAKGPAVVVETGTNHGFSTIVLAQAIRDSGVAGTVHTVELDPLLADEARRNVKEAGLDDLVVFQVDDSVSFLEKLRATVAAVDFAFLDASHARRDVIAEFRAVLPLVRGGGTVYFDNTSAGGVKHALKWVRLRYGGNLVELPRCSWGPPGNAIWQPRRSARRSRG